LFTILSSTSISPSKCYENGYFYTKWQLQLK
jgi:hypothetical protein